MRTLILVRHGETIENSTGDLQGCDPTRGRLTARGMEQARVVGRALADVPPEPPVVVSLCVLGKLSMQVTPSGQSSACMGSENTNTPPGRSARATSRNTLARSELCKIASCDQAAA